MLILQGQRAYWTQFSQKSSPFFSRLAFKTRNPYIYRIEHQSAIIGRCTYATHSQKTRQSLITKETAKEWKDLTMGQKVVAAGKTTTNIGVIALGVGIMGTLVYVVWSEFFGSSSTNTFSDALEKIRVNEELQQILGHPIKGHGEPSQSRRRRNRRIAYQIVEDTKGNEHMLMRFFVEGPGATGTVHLDMVRDERGKWDYHYLFVDVPGYGLPSKRYFVVYNEKYKDRR
ncbi:uncharacterized protein VTP21DRAFT_9010 [Calcarisporiella thermophila]|uniref:uncharacterized protein n=1 Tax=Calcarisporiella thermophila TaxID=911321 RepID=UPI0037448182